MKLLGAWITVNVIAYAVVFTDSIVTFDHFWQKWELLAAATAAAYNLAFPIVLFVYSKHAHVSTLHNTLVTPPNVVTYLYLRVILPSGLLIGASVAICIPRHHGHGPIEPKWIYWKLGLTFLAFLAIFLGDWLTARHLRKLDHPSEADLHWARHLKRHAWIIDLPLVIGYIGLILIFRIYDATEDQLLVQAFIGGASALEMLILSAVHGFAEFAEQDPQSTSAPRFRASRRASVG